MLFKLEPLKEEILTRFDSGESCSSIAKDVGEYL